MIQDIYPHQFYNAYRPEVRPEENSPVLCFDGKNILTGSGDRLFPTLGDLQINGNDLIYAFAVDETAYFICIEMPQCCPEGYTWKPLFSIRGTESNVTGMIAFTGYHLYQWYTDCLYCGSCGHRNEHVENERAMQCPACGRRFYPRIMPAVIVAVTDGEKILLTKYKEGFKLYALIAGFTEIGETLEETVAREVFEETGLKVKNIRYYKSQPWGIANDLLVGFFCDVDGSNVVKIDETELKLAEWKNREEIELHPDSYSLTNEMMRVFKERKVIPT